MSSDESSPEIDFQHLKQYVGDDVELTKEVFGLFKHQVDMWLRALIFDADDEAWVSVSHSLKGSARAVGAANLGVLCEKAEQMVGDKNRTETRKRLIQDVNFCIERILIEIQRWEYRQTLASLRS